MNKKRLLGICLIFLMVAFVFIQPAYGGPGGQLAKVLANTFWGKMVLSLLSLILLPVGIYLYIKQKLAERRAYKDLRFMAQYDPNFDGCGPNSVFWIAFIRYTAPGKKKMSPGPVSI